MMKPKLILAVMLIVGAAGCHSARPIFPPVTPPLVWPAPPDTARIQYVGQLRSTDDLHPVRTGLQQFGDVLTGRRRTHRLLTPTDVAVYQDTVYVADPGQAAVVVFDMKQRQSRLLMGSGSNHLVVPTHLAVSDHRVFVSDASTRSVAVFDHSGRFLSTLGKDEFQRPAGLCWCPENHRLYVVDVAAHCVVILNDDGKVIGKFGERGSAVGHFNFPSWITYNGTLGLLITDSMNARVQRFDLEGRFVSAFGKKGNAAGSFSLPKGLSCDSQGHIYVVDNQFENVQIFDSAGRLLLNFGVEGQQPGQFWLPEGIFIDHRDRIWVSDMYNRRIQVFQYLHVEETPR